MEPILVPAPPPSAFNKQRRMSDLIKKQVEHFKHLETKLAPEDRAKLPRHVIVTEDDAARYIAPFTRYLMAQATSAVQKRPLSMASRRAKEKGLAIAASADSEFPKSKKTKTQPKKKSGNLSKRNK